MFVPSPNKQQQQQHQQQQHQQQQRDDSSLSRVGLSFPTSEEQLDLKCMVSVQDSDVLCGRGKLEFNHVGNVKFREAIRRSLDHYLNADKGFQKAQVVLRILSQIKEEGGRFLKQEDNDEWVALSDRECKEKVSRAMRDTARMFLKQQGDGPDPSPSASSPARASSCCSEIQTSSLIEPTARAAIEEDARRRSSSSSPLSLIKQQHTKSSLPSKKKSVLPTSISMLEQNYFQELDDNNMHQDNCKKESLSTDSSETSATSLLHPYETIDSILLSKKLVPGLGASFDSKSLDRCREDLEEGIHLQSKEGTEAKRKERRKAFECCDKDDQFLNSINDTLGPLDKADVLDTLRLSSSSLSPVDEATSNWKPPSMANPFDSFQFSSSSSHMSRQERPQEHLKRRPKKKENS